MGLIEIYDLDSVVDSRLANVSTRGFVGDGNDVLIGRMILDGAGGTIVLRAIGPSLEGEVGNGVVQDPTLELHSEDGSLVASNDDWRDGQEAALEEKMLSPSDDRESGLVVTLPGGSYTAIVRGKNGSAGTGLVEFYRIE